MNNDQRIIQEIQKLKSRVDKLERQEKPVTGIYPDTYFDDLQYSLVGQKMESPSSHITYTTYRDYVSFNKTCDWNDDWVTMVIQMSHRWKLGSVVYPHLHWVQTAAAMPNLLISYRWNINGGLNTFPAWTPIVHSANAYTWSTGAALNQITKFGSITPPTGAGLSDLLHIRIFRDVANESTLFGGAEVDVDVQDLVQASSFDIHFEIDSAGSDSEYTK